MLFLLKAILSTYGKRRKSYMYIHGCLLSLKLWKLALRAEIMK